MDAPAVILTPEAAAYVRSRGGVLTLRRSPRHGCCGGSVTLAVAEAVAPPGTAGFVRHDVADLVVYVEDGFGPGGPLHVGLDRLLGFASLYVEGAEAQM